MECKQLREDGANCQAQAVSNDEYCFAHSQLPEIVEKRQAAKVTGGQNGRKMIPGPAQDEISVKGSREILNLLEKTINDLRRNRITTGQANSIAILANVMSRIQQQEVMETRIAILEKTVLISRERVKE